MLRIALNTLFVLLFILSSQVQACLYQAAGSDDLYQVFNHFFFEASDSARLGSDIELLNSSYFIPNGEDTQWAAAGDVMRVDATFRGGSFWQELGYVTEESYRSVIAADALKQRGYRQQGAVFTLPEGFVWSDTIGVWGDAPLQRWYAEAEMNPFGGKDHFLAFAIDDDDLLAVFNGKFGTDYRADADDLWMIAFEDLNLGDADYTDLVAIVSRPAELNPVPLPASGLLFAGALGGLAYLRRRLTFRV